MMFDTGDDTLVEALFQSGLQMHEVANKWGITASQMRSYCYRVGIKPPPSDKQKAIAKSQKARRLVESGQRPSPAVMRIIELEPTLSPAEIAQQVGKTLSYVKRMIDVFVYKDKMKRHRDNVRIVRTISANEGISESKACKLSGIEKNKFQHSVKALKKAPNK